MQLYDIKMVILLSYHKSAILPEIEYITMF